MKRSSNLIVLPVLVLLFSASGCSPQYQSERHLYRATKLAKNILINPEAIPPQQFNRALDAYKVIFEKYPDTWSAKRAKVAIGSLYLSKKEYAKAREAFNEVIEIYTDDKRISLEAWFAIAKSYESEDRWPVAISKYNEIIKEYPKTGIGFGLPMYIARHYEEEGDIAKRNRSYVRAISHYAKIVEENPKSEIGYRAQNFIALCYVRIEDWARAVENLKKLAMDYPVAKNISLTMRMIGDISVKRMNTPDLAIEIFEEFLERNPSHPAGEAMKKGLEELRNVSVGE